MAYILKEKYPSIKTPGIYPEATNEEIGLDTDNLEDFSLGNWNSIIKDNKLFISYAVGGLDVIENPMGRPVKIKFGEGIFSESTDPLGRILIKREGDQQSGYGDIIDFSTVGTPLDSIFTVPSISYFNETMERITGVERDRFLDAYGFYFDGSAVDWDNREFKENLGFDFCVGFAFIEERSEDDEEAPLVMRFDNDILNKLKDLVYERELEAPFDLNLGDGWTHELFFPNAFRIRNPAETTSSVLIDDILSFPFDGIDSSGFNNRCQFNFTDELEDTTSDYFTNLGAPLFKYNPIVSGSYDFNISDLQFNVNCLNQNNNNLLYYDIDDDRYFETSYPLKVMLNIGLFGNDDFDNTPIPSTQASYGILNLFYLEQDLLNQYIEDSIGSGIYDSHYRYQVIQWGDEKNLLTNDQIESLYYFSLYDMDEYPQADNYIAKKSVSSQYNSIPIEEQVHHIYNKPGVKSIKIVLYRYTRDQTLLLQTFLITKNIVINDGNLKSQDFSQFGGTEFNFLPLENKNQAVIGGLAENSQYNVSVEKIVKDDNFIKEDYLERVSSMNYVFNYSSSLYGKSPGQLDLGINRMFKGSYDIYNFITDDVSKIVQDNFEITELPINSSATDIFINDNNCILELVPQELDYLTIPNQAGTNIRGILIGDYKVNQPKNGSITREEVMQTPSLENNNDTQAF